MWSENSFRNPSDTFFLISSHFRGYSPSNYDEIKKGTDVLSHGIAALSPSDKMRRIISDVIMHLQIVTVKLLCSFYSTGYRLSANRLVGRLAGWLSPVTYHLKRTDDDSLHMRVKR